MENVHGNDHNKETQQKRYSQIVLTSSCDLIDRSERKTWRNFKLQGHKSAAAPGSDTPLTERTDSIQHINCVYWRIKIKKPTYSRLAAAPTV